MKFKKLVSIVTALALFASLAGCAKQTGKEETTQLGRITVIDGTGVTLALGEWAEEDAQQPPQKPEDSDEQTPPALPGNAGEGADASSDAQDSTQPTPPDNTSNGGAPSAPSGDGSDTTAPNGGSDAAPSDTPPQKPEGDGDDSATPPAPPSGGNAEGGSAPADRTPPGGSAFTESSESLSIDLADIAITSGSESLSAEDLSVGMYLEVTLDAQGKVLSCAIASPAGGGMPGQGGGSGEVSQGSSANTISEDGSYADLSYTSTGDDENALRIDGAEVTLSGMTVQKSGGASSNPENGDFYGTNAALLATNGANVTIEEATITSSAQNGNGVFSYGSGTTVTVSNSTITTTADNSGGIQTTGGGTTYANNLTVDTAGNSSAAIRSDRGGGTVLVQGGSYASHGYNSPAVYSTADIQVKDATLTAENSEALVIEGNNSILLESCTVTGSMSKTEGASSSINVHNVLIYQSMSGDAAEGLSTFSMTGGSLTGTSGDLLYVTNTSCEISLSQVAISNLDANGLFLRVSGNSAANGWGKAGSNGAQAQLTLDAQQIAGDIEVDTISSLQLTMKNGSVYTGAVNIVDNAEGGSTDAAHAVITIEEGCVWEVTGDCTITSLENAGTIHLNGHTITLANGTVLR